MAERLVTKENKLDVLRAGRAGIRNLGAQVDIMKKLFGSEQTEKR